MADVENDNPQSMVIDFPLHFVEYGWARVQNDLARYMSTNGLVTNLDMERMGEFIKKALGETSARDLAYKANVNEIFLKAILNGSERYDRYPREIWDEVWARLASALDVSIVEFPLPTNW